ncbi:uncharacterized protein SETTUDRAFT_158065 [Exserohilum turcica Et28A]|uniref:Diacylglycerol O-acyltransferase n=1 Tax=Exserohilum turcicum (strain 28A) TaxID=671987 RepID=R0I6M2_EXST2|nr:uncharacterized protein SETTUDRAFT_158065 [Exserohilum turcica Et28A]EOA81126.1 hypothetical protein SETTUDRAFT_158065 [Exserohilum turcica Et28A]
MSQKNVQLRAASPYERRLAIREELNFYNAMVLGAVYEFSDPKFNVKSIRSFVRPLKSIIEKHAFMGVVLNGKDTESPVWERVPSVKLDNHITILDEAQNPDELFWIEKALPTIVDTRTSGPSPPWRVYVLPLLPKNGRPCAFVAFAMSHSIGDGGAAIVFLQALREALQQSSGVDNNFEVVVPERELPEPFDTPERLPISPEFLKSIMSSSVVGAGTWTGSKVFMSEGGLQTKIRMLEVQPQHVEAALQAARVHGTKLTPLIHQLIVRALSKVVVDKNVQDFASTTAFDLRSASGVGLEWGLYISGHSASHPRVSPSSSISSDEWQSARTLSKKLGEVASTLDNQVIGMLRFVPNHKESMTSKIGSTRDASYALSNMLAFDGGKAEDSVRTTKLIVTSSAAVPSAPLSFCLISVKGGSLVCTLNWQPGALGVPLEKEDAFINGICSSLKADFANLEQAVKAPRARI